MNTVLDAAPTGTGWTRRFLVAAALVVAGCASRAPAPTTTSPPATACVIASPGAHRLRLVVAAVPDGTPDDAAIFVAGTFNGWQPGAPDYRLRKQADGSYALTLPDSVGGPVEFKFTMGTWEKGEVAASGESVENRRTIVPDSGATYTGSVAGWQVAGAPKRHTATSSVSILSDSFPMPQLGRARRVWLYLPPDYATSGRRYPVFYMHDGQNLFDAATGYAGEWGIDETLDSLNALGDRGVIVVAPDHGGERRFTEYSPWVNAQYGGGEGDEYVDFLVHTLKPYVDTHYRTLPGRTHTGVGGSSMGGLISLYAILAYPDVFGRALIFSPAFWVAPPAFDQARAAAPPPPDTRVWFTAGGHEGTDPEVMVGDQQRMVRTLAAAGWDSTVVRAYVRPDGQHSEWFWRREFPAAYQWLFPDTD